MDTLISIGIVLLVIIIISVSSNSEKGWSLGKKIRYFFFSITCFVIDGFGFAFPSERDEFYRKFHDNDTFYG